MLRLEEDEPSPGICDQLHEIVRSIGLLCYVACPPIPSEIIRKLAFHPPDKGATYRIELKSDPEKDLESVRDCHDEPVQLVVRDRVHPEVKVFSVTTSEDSHLVCVKCSPNCYSKNPEVANQVVLFCQSSSADLGSFLQPNSMNFSTFANLFETDVYAFDYSGYGFSSGTQSEKNMYADVRAVYEHILKTRPDKKIVVIGYSIGTTAAVDLAASNPDRLVGVVLIAPLTSALRMFCNNPDKETTCIDKICHINTRVLICHGDHDQRIPMTHGMALYENLKNPVPPLIVHGANHHSIISGEYIEVFTRIASFMRNETLLSCRANQIESSSSKKFKHE
ncbi:Serine aminopeptidase S33 domain-containing protein [Caenorhabditis elegans]|uniref:Serine aminopeptidase S33 domain-containing protein n=1 Tax=Caenorhabditis elegans TaxID=6239 RepID=Q9XVB2_CAEEL|nr:Serine aminopeptidase S33 domain-containing protein [Caenorhabditis elegans]CAB04038.1 Serine aminopeptidase S33 domain-containing protein [Caenorhabditis elegans]|eukprot:NP_001022066.1 Uncharacterized protein CELE_F01D5.7 [Caenorhabditis elegans]